MVGLRDTIERAVVRRSSTDGLAFREGIEITMGSEHVPLEGPELQHPGARHWSSRLGRLGALLTLLIPLGMLIVGWAFRGVPNLPVPQTRPGRLPEAHWAMKSPLATPRDNFGVATVGGRAWILGGVSDEQAGRLASTEIYDPATDSWTPGPALPFGRSAFRAIAVGDTIYIFGGASAEQAAIDSVQALDTTTDQWQTLAPLPVPLVGHAVVESAGTIYVLGGSSQGNAVGTVYAYTPATNAWQTLAPLPTPRDNLAAAVLNGQIYALGGMVNGAASTVVEVYDPATGRWTSGPVLLGAMSNFGAAVYNGRIHTMLNGVQQVFDPRANEWVTDSPMPTSRSGQGIAVIGDTLYAIGGRAEESQSDLGTVEAYLPGEAVEPDNFRLTGINPGGAVSVIAGLIVTFTLTGTMLYVSRRKRPIDQGEEEANR